MGPLGSSGREGPPGVNGDGGQRGSKGEQGFAGQLVSDSVLTWSDVYFRGSIQYIPMTLADLMLQIRCDFSSGPGGLDG